MGGTRDGNQSGLIRINLTDIWDAHSLVAYSYNANDGGQLTLSSTGPAAVSTNQKPVFSNSLTFDTTQYLNFIRSPENPFVGDATLDVFNYASFTNNGAGVEWIPFDVGGTDYHRMVTMTDPTTGLPRIIFGNDQGIWSVLDSNGTFETQIGSSDILPSTERNGNLQITQFYYGAAQPSNAAALIAGSLFYGMLRTTVDPVQPPILSRAATSSGMVPAAMLPAWPRISKAWVRSTNTGGPAAAATPPTSSRSTARDVLPACSRRATASRPRTHSGHSLEVPTLPLTRSMARTS